MHAKELDYVKRWYRVRTTQQIADELGKSLGQVYRAAGRLGLSIPQKGIGQAAKPRIRELHAKGYSDSEIAADVGCSREHVRDLRRHLGLPSNKNNQRHRARVAAKTAEQCLAAGVRSLGAIRAIAYRDRARAAGWPEDLRPRHVEMLDLLYDHGPKTRREIADALGMPWKGSRQSLSSNDPEGSYLAHLIKRGLVICLARKLLQGGQGKNVSLYMVPPYVERHRKE